uniref:Uncharacterized protein n=1 Tax=Graphocephala atropunctata TaxID=36148 RepID=A0A1B6L2N6_9HEMI
MMPRTKLKGKKSSLALRWKQRVKAASQASQEHSLSDWSGVLTEVQSHDEFLSNLNTYYDHQKQENCLNYEKACTNVKMVFRNIQQQFPDRIKLVNVMKSCEEYSDDENNNPNTVATSSDRSRSHKLTEFKESCKSRSSSRKHLPSVTQTPTVLATVKKDSTDELQKAAAWCHHQTQDQGQPDYCDETAYSRRNSRLHEWQSPYGGCHLTR